MTAECRKCGLDFPKYNTLQRVCGRCVNRTLKPKKRMKGIGRVTQKWIETRQEWIRLNPPVDGMYECYLRITPECPRFMVTQHMTLDHVKSRSRYPELRFDLNNLRPACWSCNREKGSRDL